MKEKIEELFKTAKVDCVLLRNLSSSFDCNFSYFSSLGSIEIENGFLVLSKGKKPVLLTNTLDFGLARKKAKNCFVIAYKNEKDLQKKLKKYIKGKKIGFNGFFYPVFNFKKLKKLLPKKRFEDISEELGKVRETKTKEEIKKIQKACEIAEKALQEMPKIAKAGKTEEQIAKALEFKAKELGAEGLAFPTIVAFGKNASIPHYRAGKTKIGKKGFLLIDFGVKVEGYCSDLSRTFFVGKAGKKEKEMYSIVWQAQQKAIKKAKEGIKAGELFKEANGLIQKKLKQKMIHSLGHGLGLEVHDFPNRMGENAEFLLKKGMVLTAEPGYYNPRMGGIRIEDDIVIERKGCRVLSKRAPRELIEI